MTSALCKNLTPEQNVVKAVSSTTLFDDLECVCCEASLLRKFAIMKCYIQEA